MSYEKLLNEIEAQMNSDKLSCIPLQLERVGHIINIRQNHYTLIGGGTGTGKTSFVDEKYILEPYDWLKAHPESGFKVRWFYRSMERRTEIKLAKWASNKLYRDKGIILSSDEILMLDGNKLSQEKFDLVKQYLDYFEEMLDYVEIQDGTDNPFGIFKPLEEFGYKNGLLIAIKFDKEGKSHVYVYDHSKKPLIIKEFSEREDNYIVTKSGDKRYYEDISYLGKEYRVFLKHPIYIADNPSLFVIPIVDHLGKVSIIENYDDRKTINKTSELLSTLRDQFRFSPVIISQFNRSLADVGRMKLFKGDLQPQLEDFESSARTQHDADLILALFNPYRYKSYDADGFYRGYQIRDKMMSPQGHNRFRTLSVLKNSNGVDDISLALKFFGEAGSFKMLPLTTAKAQLDYEYEIIAQGL